MIYYDCRTIKQHCIGSRSSLSELKTRAEYDAFKSTISGPKGQLTEVMKLMGTVPKEDKPAMGKFINEAKQQIQAIMEATQVRIEDSESLAQLGPKNIDLSLPSPDLNRGSIHPIAQVRDVIVDLFHRIGFAVAEGTELETEYYCFDALNIPAIIPHVTCKIPTSCLGLVKFLMSQNSARSVTYCEHTSSVQIRTLLKEKPPIRIIAPGRCFRRDTPDATHSANFHQIEGLYVDKQVSLTDLKSTLDYFVKGIFGAKAKTRLRPSFPLY